MNKTVEIVQKISLTIWFFCFFCGAGGVVLATENGIKSELIYAIISMVIGLIALVVGIKIESVMMYDN